MAASVTLLPALLGFAGRNIERWHVPFVRKDVRAYDTTRWYRWSRFVQRRPWVAAIGGLAVLIALAAPFLGIRFGFPDAKNDVPTATSRQAYDLLADGFGTGFNGPMLVVVDLDAPGVDAADLPGLAEDIAAIERIVSVSEPQTSADGGTAVFTAIPTTGPADPDTSIAIDQVRELIPDNVYISGITAVTDDVNTQLRDTLPLFIGVVIAISFLLLMTVFRSVVVPLKAAAMNLLSIGAAYGVLVAVFQWGWGSSLIGLEGPTPITSIIIVIMFPILFGLSMDYEVFLLSRVKEEYDRTGDNVESVARGLAGTGRVITSAALIMIVVFLSFVASPVPSLKMLGLGLATAILVDATIVRMVLVPATMALLGKANWWLPAWLDRILPNLTVHGSTDDAEDEESAYELVSR
jgi:RND superfamily putative drug exporter